MRQFKLPPIGPRTRKALKIVGYVLAGLISFVYAFHLTFPYDRLKDKGVEALSSKYDVTVGGVERGWLPGDFSLTKVQLRTRPEKPGEVPKMIFIDRIDIDIALLSALGGEIDVEIDAEMGPGRIAGTVTIGKDSLKVALSSRNLPLTDVPGLASIIGMPMGGRGDVSARLDLPKNNWARANARISVKCPGCTIGGEGAFFKPRTTTRTGAFVGEGVPVPLIAINNLEADWSIAGGKITTNKFLFDSPHLAVELDFTATVEKELKNARVENACLRYRGTDELKKLDEKFYNALELSGGPLGADDMRHLKLVGTLGNFKALGKECGGAADSQPDPVSGEPRGRRSPNLSDVPEPDAVDPAAAAATGQLDVKPAEPTPPDATNGGAPEIQPTPTVEPRGAASGGGGDGAGGGAGNGGAGDGGQVDAYPSTFSPSASGVVPPDGTPATRGDGSEAPSAPPASGNDSVHFEGQPRDENPQPPPENE